MFRIVRSSNFDKDWYNEEFLNIPPVRADAAERIARTLNVYLGYESSSSEHIYKIVPEGYQLYIGMIA